MRCSIVTWFCLAQCWCLRCCMCPCTEMMVYQRVYRLVFVCTCLYVWSGVRHCIPDSTIPLCVSGKSTTSEVAPWPLHLGPEEPGALVYVGMSASASSLTGSSSFKDCVPPVRTTLRTSNVVRGPLQVGRTTVDGDASRLDPVTPSGAHFLVGMTRLQSVHVWVRRAAGGEVCDPPHPPVHTRQQASQHRKKDKKYK